VDRGVVILLVAVAALGAAWGYLRQGGGGETAARAAPAAPVPRAVATTATGAADVASPRAAFAHACGMCHTLRAARARGITGPDLDALRPSARRVRRMIRTGSRDGVMQPNLVHGREARAVATYVARASRR
jgi:mono/diheme cytochrome c family protein